MNGSLSQIEKEVSMAYRSVNFKDKLLKFIGSRILSAGVTAEEPPLH